MKVDGQVGEWVISGHVLTKMLMVMKFQHMISLMHTLKMVKLELFGFTLGLKFLKNKYF